jgi:phosphatidate cytidylyltransferase
MLLQRVITSLILIPLVFALLFYAPVPLVFAVVVLLVIAAGRECRQLIPLEGAVSQTGFLLALAFCLYLSNLCFEYWLLVSFAGWFLVAIAVVDFPHSVRYWGDSPFVALMCLLFLSAFGQSVLHLSGSFFGKQLLVYLLALVWASDIGAYFCGKAFGKHKLIVNVSPGKSWEGALGGLIFVLVVAFVGAYYFEPANYWGWILFAACLHVVSIFGDLFVSILKRRCNVKDTGTIVKGHGGILDRLDSTIAALPFFYWGVRYLI